VNPIKFKLAESRKSKSGEYPIYLRFNHSDTELVYPTGEKCQLSEWDAEKEKFRRSMPGYQQANEYLQLLRERLTIIRRFAPWSITKARNCAASVNLGNFGASIRRKYSATNTRLASISASSLAAMCRS
jgi:hypothetical protein